MTSFGGIEERYSGFEQSMFLLQSIPYDGTSTWGKGADKGFRAFIEASENMELYDWETDCEAYRKGIHIVPEIEENSSPEMVYRKVLETTERLLETNKFPTFFGGEHAISIGIIEAFNNKYKNLTVLQLDAHADLRPSYLGTPFNHACAMHAAAKNTNLIQVGIRSMDISEKQFLDPDKCFFAEDIHGSTEWMDESISLMTNDVYLSIDLDVFDPSIMPSTGTPEPGGLGWNTTIRFLRKVFESKRIVGFDIVELAPISHLKAPDFLAAKLYYKLLSYKIKYNG